MASSARPAVTTVDEPMTPVGERLAATASGLFYARGIRAVGVELIAAEAGTTKKTLYDRFGSKDALVTLYLRRRAALWQATAVAYLDEHHPAPGVGRVLGVFDALGSWLAVQWRGCAFVNAYVRPSDLATAPAIPDPAAGPIIRTKLESQLASLIRPGWILEMPADAKKKSS